LHSFLLSPSVIYGNNNPRVGDTFVYIINTVIDHFVLHTKPVLIEITVKNPKNGMSNVKVIDEKAN
jgi:hypothetical protein